ncbi:MAG: FG-GAP repeat domain-containing protein, partial [Lysobacterales bacterium]
IVSNRALVSSHYVTQAESRGQQLGGDTIFTVLESVGADMASADDACDTVTAEFSTQQESVAATLSNLNISTEKTNRVDEKGEDLPEDYAPLGSRKALGGNSEIYLAGLTPLNSSDESSLLKYSPASGGQDASTLHLPGFSLNTDWKSSPYNAVASGDVDGDGFEELAQLWWNATNNAITLNILDDESQSFEQSSPSVLITANPTQLQVIMADVDADGEDEIVIAIVEDGDGSIEMYVLEGSKDSGFSLGSSKSFAATQADSTLTIEMEAGQLDRDGGEELVVVVSETWGSGQNGSPANGQAHYYIFDDLKAGLALRATDRISAFVDGSTRDGVTGTV